LEKEILLLKWRKLASTSLGHFVNDGIVTFIPVIVDIVAFERNISPLVFTVIVTAFYATSSLLSIFAENLADKNPSQGPLIGLGLFLLSAGMLGFYVSMVYTSETLLETSIIISGLIAGFGSAFYHPIAATVLQSAFSSEKGKAMGINGAFGSVGAAIFPPLFFFTAIFLSKVGALLLLALISFTATTVVWLGLREED
jgi:MFS family permease